MLTPVILSSLLSLDIKLLIKLSREIPSAIVAKIRASPDLSTESVLTAAEAGNNFSTKL
mgnify:CR=1 FL=1